MTELPSASLSVLELLKYNCAVYLCRTKHCHCKTNGLLCTDFCGCSDDCENHDEDEPLLYDEDRNFDGSNSDPAEQED